MTAALGLSRKQRDTVGWATARINLWEGSIRSGKTIGSLVAWLAFVHRVMSERVSGELAIIGKTRESVGRNVLAPLTDPNIYGQAARHIRYTAGAPTCSIFGRTIHVLGANDAKAEPKVRGMTLAGCYVDEATVIPEAFFRQLLGRMSAPGARMFATTNPDNPAHWLRQSFILRERDLDMRVFHFTLDDNPGLAPAYVAAIKAEYTGLWYRRFVLGEWVQAEGAVYDAWDEDRHLIRGPLPPTHRLIACGVDYGTRNPFAALVLVLDDHGRLVLTREYRHDPRHSQRSMTDADYSTALRDFLGDPRPEWIAVDPSAASFKLQLFRDGIPGVMDADNAVVDGIRTVASLLATDRLLVHESCHGLLSEIPGYSWDDEAAAKGEDKPVKVADHSVDAMRYAIATSRVLWTPHLADAA